MRVRVREACTPYWNYQVHRLVAGAEVDGEFAAYLAETGVPVERLDAAPGEPVGVAGPQEAEPAPPRDESNGPAVDWTAAEVLSWAGEDLQRAEQALEAENARDKPRSTLVKALERLVVED